MGITTLLALFTGFFAGTTALLAYVVRILQKQTATANAERMMWCNKALVREGQTKLFSDTLIEGKVEPAEPNTFAPVTMASPFRSGLSKLKEKVVGERKAEAGSKLPDHIKESIIAATEKAKAA